MDSDQVVVELTVLDRGWSIGYVQVVQILEVNYVSRSSRRGIGLVWIGGIGGVTFFNKKKLFDFIVIELNCVKEG